MILKICFPIFHLERFIVTLCIMCVALLKKLLWIKISPYYEQNESYIEYKAIREREECLKDKIDLRH